MRPEDVQFTADDGVRVFGGGFGDEAYVTGSIELDGPAVLVHFWDAHPWEGEAPECMSLLIPPEALVRLAEQVAPRVRTLVDEEA